MIIITELIAREINQPLKREVQESVQQFGRPRGVSFR